MTNFFRGGGWNPLDVSTVCFILLFCQVECVGITVTAVDILTVPNALMSN